MPRNGKAAIFVLFTLLAAVVAATVITLRENATNAVSVLVETALLAAAMVVVSGWAAYRLWQQERRHRQALDTGALTPPVPRPWRWMSRRQWTTLTLGLTVIVTLASALAGLHVKRDQTTPQAASVSTQPTYTPSPVVAPSPTDVASPAPTDASPTLESAPATPSDDASTDDPSTVEPTTDDTPTDDSSTDDPTLAPPPPTIAYLDSLDAVNANRYYTGPVFFSGQQYPRSVNLDCESSSDYFIWSVAGYHTFTATAGVDDSTTSALGGIAEMIFYDQDGRQIVKPIDVSLAHPQKVTLDLTGVVQLKITCAGRDSKTNSGQSFYAALGNAEITQ